MLQIIIWKSVKFTDFSCFIKPFSLYIVGARTFDVDDGQHPVQMVLDQLTEPLYDPIQTWLEELVPGFPCPKDYILPVTWQWIEWGFRKKTWQPQNVDLQKFNPSPN